MMRGPMRMAPAKPKNIKVTMTKLMAFLKPYLPVIALSLILAVAGTILQISGPDKLKELTNLILDGLRAGIDMDAVKTVTITLVCFYGTAAILNFTQSYIMATTTARIGKKMRAGILDKINKLPLSYFDSTSYGDVLSRMTNDVDAITQTLNQSLAGLVGAATMFFGALIMMLVTNWILALTAVAASIVGFAMMMVIMGKSQAFFIAQQGELGAINGQIEEIYSGHNIVKAYNGSAAAKENFEGVNRKLYQSAWKSQFMSGLMMPLMGFIGNFGYVAVCVVGAVLAMNGTISFGVIVAFMMYVRLFTQPLSQLAQAFQNLQRTAAASERVFEMLDAPEMKDESEKAKTFGAVKGNVTFDHLRFSYVEGKPIIKDFSAEIAAGQKVAIVGPTGAGKTTLVNLLMRFYEPDSGRILLDGIGLDEVTREEVHRQFSMVLQDTWLFEGTIRDNIVYAMENVTDEQVKEACKAVGIHHFIKTMSKGYDTLLDDKASLSQGQRQLITIARAMIQNAPLLILDEATSSVDTRTEIIIQKAMDQLTHGRTSFVIAHRLSTIKNADIILVMRDGDIVETGNHEALLEQKGFYAELYNSQFEQ